MVSEVTGQFADKPIVKSRTGQLAD